MTTRIVFVLSVSVGLLAGCSAPPDEPVGDLSVRRATPKALRTIARGKEFSLPFLDQLDVGTGQAERSELGYEKVVGSRATYAMNPHNRAVLFLPNADAPRVSFRGTPEEHNSLVRKFYVDAGLPPSEIDNVVAMTGALEGAPVGEPFAIVEQRIGSVIHRRLGGVRVSESFAWAVLDEAGDVYAAGAYWPNLSADVVARAAALQDRLADVTKRALYVDALPESARAEATNAGGSGEVFIRHSLFINRSGEFAARPVFRIIEKRNQMAESRHFDSNGAELYPSEEVRP